MNREEFRQLSYKFLAALEQRLLKEGYNTGSKPEIVQTNRNSLIIRVATDYYELYNDGDRADWAYVGGAGG